MGFRDNAGGQDVNIITALRGLLLCRSLTIKVTL